jgi:hypothetical protein
MEGAPDLKSLVTSASSVETSRDNNFPIDIRQNRFPLRSPRLCVTKINKPTHKQPNKLFASFASLRDNPD